MRAYVKKLQSKPESVRKQIFYGSLIVAMVLVVSVWIGGLGYRFNKQNSVATTDETIKPFALFGQSITDTYDNISASVGDISKNIKKEMPKTEKEEASKEKVIDLIPVEYQ